MSSFLYASSFNRFPHFHFLGCKISRLYNENCLHIQTLLFSLRFDQIIILTDTARRFASNYTRHYFALKTIYARAHAHIHIIDNFICTKLISYQDFFLRHVSDVTHVRISQSLSFCIVQYRCDAW